MSSTDTDLTAVTRMARDLAAAASTMSAAEARYLVDAYYTSQDGRKRADSQVKAMGSEPHAVIEWLAKQSEILEGQVKRALDKYTDGQPIGVWMKEIYGIGPVISAGLLAHIDITKAATVGDIWRFAGLDPTSQWGKGEKRPWNARLKVLCWHAGQSFMKTAGNVDPETGELKSFYGPIYKSRKEYEIKRNERGDHAALCKQLLAEKTASPDAVRTQYLKEGKLPPAAIDGRARRYAVKLFLSHLQMVWWFIQNGQLPVSPFILTPDRGHTRLIVPPHMEVVPGLVEAVKQMVATRGLRT